MKVVRLGAAPFCAIMFATAASAGPGYTSSAPIAALAGRDIGLDVTMPQANNPMNCSVAGVFRLLPTATNYDTVAAIIMSAQAQQKPIYVYVTSCSSDGVSVIVAAQF